MPPRFEIHSTATFLGRFGNSSYFFAGRHVVGLYQSAIEHRSRTRVTSLHLE